MIDFYLQHFSSIPMDKMESDVLELLRVGAAQILYMERIPDSAAVDTAVSGCRALGRKKACGFVNAVLRNMIREKNNLPEPDSSDPEENLSIRYSHPKWLVHRLVSRYGREHTEYHADEGGEHHRDHNGRNTDGHRDLGHGGNQLGHDDAADDTDDAA